MSLHDLAADDGSVSLRDLLRGIRKHHPQMTFMQTNLISDGSVPAQHVDANLINPWDVIWRRGDGEHGMARAWHRPARRS
jgi:hypothetical protein